MPLGTITTKDKIHDKVGASPTTTPATATKATNSPSPKRTKRRRTRNSTLSNAGSALKQVTLKLNASHGKI